MKVLCICHGGNVRSVALAQYLKDKGHDAIAMCDNHASKETKEMLFKWADKVIDLRDHLPYDIWHNPRHEDLKKKVRAIWKSVEEPL